MTRKIITPRLGKVQATVDKALEDLATNRILPRIWEKDHSVWKPEPQEITDRLGWLTIAERMKANLPQIQTLTDNVRSEGYTQTLLLGMGGSSLAPEVFRKTFGVKDGYLDLAVLDSTDPDTVASLTRQLNWKKTLFIVSTKSGGTVETLSFFKYCYRQVVEKLGKVQAGAHFIAITDPGSRLESLAQNLNFRQVFLNDPHIGGRYSALSFFGLVPAALLGIDVTRLLDRALEMAASPTHGTQLGAILGSLANLGRDKVTFVLSKKIASFGDWVEQLIAESTGKDRKGILPVIAEILGPPEVYGKDRIFFNLNLGVDSTFDQDLRVMENAGFPIVYTHLDDLYDLGGQFFLWELATAVAGYFLKINPFDQPNVESAKILARQMVAEYTQKGALPAGESTAVRPENLHSFLSKSRPGDYISLQAYLQPTEEITSTLQDLRMGLRDRYKIATTLGFGPRFLHSTGQLHKGDSGNGFFIQFTSDPIQDVPIPDGVETSESCMSFGTLKMAQALGDGQALLDGNRP
ncbi:MAG: hypothetical protein MUO62_19265, partial [Anaerolineales bacterium]|nr:hypothetical protein [Anaerolineales bacterium]